MISLGFLALGAFIGGMVGLFLFNTPSDGWKKPVTGLTTVLGAVVSGAPVALAQYVVGDTGLAATFAMYPIGLVLGILTPYLQLAGQNWKEGTGQTNPDIGKKRLAIAHYTAYATVVVFGVAVFVAPKYVVPHFEKVDSYFLGLSSTPNSD